ncbi:MAG: nitrate reductase molybdenum cofactor assembly chaperone [Asticcacaulis sp.]
MLYTYKALALFLAYPEEDTQALMPEAFKALQSEGRLNAPLLRALGKLADRLSHSDLYDLQEAYVHLFDRTRSLSLNLYEHVHGESRDRGQAMAALKSLYEAAGLELTAQELPDYLPVFLEFLSLQTPEKASTFLADAAHVLEAIAERLKKRESDYRAVFGALVHLSGVEAGQEAVAALLQEPEEDPDDLEALDRLWEETAVTFGPGEAGCPKAEAMVAAMATPSTAAPTGAVRPSART